MEELNDQVRRAQRHGYQVAVHAIEESAVCVTAATIAVNNRSGATPSHRIEHFSVMPIPLAARLAELGVAVVTQPSFVLHSGDRYLAHVEGHLREWIYPIKSLLESGIVVGAGPDAPVSSFNPLDGIYAATTRLSCSGQTVTAGELVTAEQALSLYTFGAARACAQHRRKGSIEPGKLADLVLLSADPTSVEPRRVREIEAEMTIIGGNVSLGKKHGRCQLKYQTILHEKNGNTATVTLNRPEALNAINSRLAGELVDVFEKTDGDDELLAVVITGADDRAFSVGLDIKEVVDAADGVADQQALMDIRRRLWSDNPWERLASLWKPTIAAIRGFALGGGLELALACDIRIASDDAKLGFPEVHLGIIPARGGTQRLPRIIGRGKAIEMILSGETIDANEAYRTQLINKVVPAGRLLTAATELASKLAENAPVAIRFAREAVAKGLDMTVDQSLRMEADLYLLLQTTQDRSEGILSFVEKRKPKFTGR